MAVSNAKIYWFDFVGNFFNGHTSPGTDTVSEAGAST
jgi:hypothetical protein